MGKKGRGFLSDRFRPRLVLTLLIFTLGMTTCSGSGCTESDRPTLTCFTSYILSISIVCLIKMATAFQRRPTNSRVRHVERRWKGHLGDRNRNRKASVGRYTHTFPLHWDCDSLSLHNHRNEEGVPRRSWRDQRRRRCRSAAREWKRTGHGGAGRAAFLAALGSVWVRCVHEQLGCATVLHMPIGLRQAQRAADEEITKGLWQTPNISWRAEQRTRGSMGGGAVSGGGGLGAARAEGDQDQLEVSFHI